MTESWFTAKTPRPPSKHRERTADLVAPLRLLCDLCPSAVNRARPFHRALRMSPPTIYFAVTCTQNRKTKNQKRPGCLDLFLFYPRRRNEACEELSSPGNLDCLIPERSVRYR